MPDRGTRPVVIAAGHRALDVVLVARGDAEPDDVDQQIFAFLLDRGWQHIGAQRRDTLAQTLCH